MEAPDRSEHLLRLIAGLEQTIASMRFQIKYYADDDTVLIYAKKFLAACEENLGKAREELAELEKHGP